MNENREQDRRDKPASFKSAIKNFLYNFGNLFIHPSQKAGDEHRDPNNDRGRRNRRARRTKSRDDERRTDSRRS